MANEKEKQTPDEIVNLSGHNLHLRIASILEKEGWKVAISPYYVDDLTDKPREIDIVARKYFTYESRADKEQKTFYLVLVIDCKHLNQNVVIWGKENQLKGQAIFTNMENRLSKLTESSENWSRYSKYWGVGRLISEGSKSNSLQEGILQAVKATLDVFRTSNSPSVFFPAVVYELEENVKISSVGNMAFGDTKPKAIDADWIFHINYAYLDYTLAPSGKRRQRDFYVDLVEEKNFIDFLHKLDEEGNAIADNLHFYSNQQ